MVKNRANSAHPPRSFIGKGPFFLSYPSRTGPRCRAVLPSTYTSSRKLTRLLHVLPAGSLISGRVLTYFLPLSTTVITCGTRYRARTLKKRRARLRSAFFKLPLHHTSGDTPPFRAFSLPCWVPVQAFVNILSSLRYPGDGDHEAHRPSGGPHAPIGRRNIIMQASCF